MANSNREFEDDIEGSGDIYGPVKGLSAIGMPDYDKSRQIMQEVEKKQNFENLKSMTYTTPSTEPIVGDAPSFNHPTESIEPSTTTDTYRPTHNTQADILAIDESIYDINVPMPVKGTSINQKPGDELYMEPEVRAAKVNSLPAVLANPKSRIMLFAGGVMTLAIIGGLSYAFTGDSKKLSDTDSGEAGVELKADPNAPLNEQQARYDMRRRQGEASELAAQGVTNAPSLATMPASATQATGGISNVSATEIAEKYRGVNYRTADINKIPDNERLLYANSQAANGERMQYYQEPLSDSSIYQPKDTRGGEVLTYIAGGITIKPDDYEQRLQRAMQAENQNNSGSQQAQSQNNNGQSQGQSQPQPDLVYENIQKSLGADYDAYTTERNAQQARLAEQRSQYQQQAAALAQSRQAVAKNALNQSIQMLTASNNAGNNYTAQIYGQKYNAANRNYAQPSTVTGNGLYGSNSLSTNANAKSTASNLLPKNIIRAGTSFPVVVTNTVNSDNGSTVTAQVVGGVFNGSKVFGQIEPQGRNIGVSFTALQPKNPRQSLIPINAIALTLSNSGGVASTVDRHYFQNYLTALAQAGIEGYGNAYAESNTTTRTTDEGTVIVSRGGADAKQVRGQILSSLAGRLNQDIGVFANRQPTYIIRQGTPLSMTLVSNVDTTASTASLNLNSSRTSNTARQQ